MIDLTELVKRTGAKRTLTIIPKEIHSIKDRSEGGSTIEYSGRFIDVVESKQEIEEIINEYNAKESLPVYKNNKDVIITIKMTDSETIRILFRKDDYDYIYRRDNRFMMIVKNNVIVREINWGRIIDILYVDDYDNNKGFCREVI